MSAPSGGSEQLGDIMAAVEKTTKQPQNKHVSAPWTDPKAQPYIRIENVTKKFGEFVAVNNVSLDIYRGELFSLLGGSGWGKTPLLRMLARFATPSAGMAHLGQRAWKVRSKSSGLVLSIVHEFRPADRPTENRLGRAFTYCDGPSERARLAAPRWSRCRS